MSGSYNNMLQSYIVFPVGNGERYKVPLDLLFSDHKGIHMRAIEYTHNAMRALVNEGLRPNAPGVERLQ